MHLRRLWLTPIVALLALLTVSVASGEPPGSVSVDAARNMPAAARLSSGARHSRFARQHYRGAANPVLQGVIEDGRARASAAAKTPAPESGRRAEMALQANADWNARSQIETSIAVHPVTGDWVITSDDFAGGFDNIGVYNSEGVTYFPPSPAMVGFDGDTLFTIEPAVASNAAVAYGFTRAATDVAAGAPVVYNAEIALSNFFCEVGVFVSRSFDNGATWFRPIVPFALPPKGRGMVAYWDQANDCSVFHDKDYITVDNTGGPHQGRVYVTWTRFDFGATLQTNTINMAYSDDNGLTFSDAVVVSGRSATLCPSAIPAGTIPDIDWTLGTAGGCDISHFSYPVVLPDGTLAVVFENGQSPNAPTDGLRGQMLMTRVDPDTLAVSGPFKIANLFDGRNDFPIDSDGFHTLCNSNFFSGVNSGNVAVDQRGTLYAVWYDDRAQAGRFPYPTTVDSSPEHRCPAGTTTDATVWISRSTDRGTTWSAPRAVSSKSGPGAHDQFSAWVAAGPKDHVDVVFYDRRLDPANQLAHTFVARSTDGGRTFRQIKVSDFPSDYDNSFALFGLPAAGHIGDYLGMTMDRFGNSYPAWTGVRPDKLDSDIFMAVVGARR